MRKKQIPFSQRQAVISLKKSGYSEKAIAKEVKISPKKVLEVTKFMVFSTPVHFGSKKEPYFTDESEQVFNYRYDELSVDEKLIYDNLKPWDSLRFCWI